MGRYFWGDIEGKFLFQYSNDADFFGTESYQQLLSYEFCKDNMEDIESGIQKCLDALGKHKDKLDKFFEGDTTYYKDSALIFCTGDAEYSEDCMAVALFGKEKAEDVGDGSQIKGILEWYARLQLGVKIRNCVKEKGSCSFTAEL